jgi:hypothetical protein
MPLVADDFEHPEFRTSIAFPEASQFASRSMPLDLARCRSMPLDLARCRSII